MMHGFLSDVPPLRSGLGVKSEGFERLLVRAINISVLFFPSLGFGPSSACETVLAVVRYR